MEKEGLQFKLSEDRKLLISSSLKNETDLLKRKETMGRS